MTAEAPPAGSVADRLRAKLARQRAEALEARQAEHRAALERFTGACAQCLDTGQAFVSGRVCACGAGAARLEAEAAAQERQRAAAIMRAYDHALHGSGMPPEYDVYTLDTYPRATPALGDLRRYLAQFDARRGLVLSGGYGTGKTALACAVARAATLGLCERDPAARFRVRFYTAAALLRSLRAAMSSRDGEYERILASARTAQLLILDDLGRANPGEWASEVLFDVVNTRYNAAAPLLITTNYAEERLAERLGEHGAAIIDRISERCVWLRLSGSSLRQRATLER